MAAKAPRAGADSTRVRFAGLLLVTGAAFTLVLHLLGAPEGLYHWLYDHLLSGLDVPEDPSEGSLDAISHVSLIGGLGELVAGVSLLAIDPKRK
jgi:hypothetical protein